MEQFTLQVMSLGDCLRLVRYRLLLTQDELSKLLGFDVGECENNEKTIDSEDIEAYANLIGVTVDIFQQWLSQQQNPETIFAELHIPVKPITLSVPISEKRQEL